MHKGTEVDSRAVLGTDRTNLELLQGYLMKRNSRGSWQKRYFIVNNQYLNYFLDRKMHKLRASCDLTDLTDEPYVEGRFGEFVIPLKSGDVYLKAKSVAEATNWVRCLKERQEYFEDGVGADMISSMTDEAEPASPMAAPPLDVKVAPIRTTSSRAKTGSDAPPSGKENEVAKPASKTRSILTRSFTSPSSPPSPKEAPASSKGKDESAKAGPESPSSPGTGSGSVIPPRHPNVQSVLAAAVGTTKEESSSESGSTRNAAPKKRMSLRRTLSASSQKSGNSDAESHPESESGGSDASKTKRLSRKKQTAVKARDIEWEERAQESCVKDGSLLKKSPSRFKAWQSRFCRIIEGSLYYYKSEKQSWGDFQGQIILSKGTSFLPAPSDDPAVFHIVTPFRTFEFKAESEQIMKDWVAELEHHCAAMEERRQEEIAKTTAKAAGDSARSLASGEGHDPVMAGPKLPDWIVFWDLVDEASRVQRLETNLDSKFAKVSSLEDTLSAATRMVEELDELATVCLGEHDRVDVMTLYMRAYQVRFEHEVSVFLVGDRYESLTIHDMLRIMDLISAYSEFRDRILQDERCKNLADTLPPFTMEDNIDMMAARYLVELQESLGTWVENIIRTNLTRGEDCVEVIRRGQSELATSAPVDMFNMINETLIMAKASGVPQVQVAVMQCCLVTVADYITTFRNELHETERGRTLMTDLRFMCAITNDCATIQDHIDDLDSGRMGLGNASLNVDWNPVRSKYSQAVVSFVQITLDMIHADCEDFYGKLFSPAHLRVGPHDLAGNIMVRVAATVQDYLGDIKAFLILPYFKKLLRLLTRDICVTYCASLLDLSPVRTNPNAWVDTVLPERVSYTSTPRMDGIMGRQKISLDDVFHIRADKEGMMRTLGLFTNNAEKLLGVEMLLWNNILDLLAVSPEFFASAVSKMSIEWSKTGQRAVIATAIACLGLREDVSAAQAGEIVHAITSSMREAEFMQKLEEAKQVHREGSAIYARVWPKVTKRSASTRTATTESASRAPATAPAAASKAVPTAAGNPSPSSAASKIREGEMSEAKDGTSPRGTVGKTANGTRMGASKSSAGSVDSETQARADKLLNNVSLDISDEAVLARKQNRHEKLDMTEDIRDIDLHGYLEKKSPSAAYVWQRRWFLVHKALDVQANVWKLALSWHKSHNSPMKGRIFLDQILRIEVLSKLPVRIAADGISLVLVKSQVDDEGSTVTESGRYEFQVVTQARTYVFRALSMSETVTWVNGLNKGSREAKRLQTLIKRAPSARAILGNNPTDEDFAKLDMGQLCAVCEANGFRTTPEMTREELIGNLKQLQAPTLDKATAAESAHTEEKEKILLTRSIADLRAECHRLGLDMSGCAEKSDLVRLLANQGGDEVGSDQEKEAQLRQLVVRGLTLLEEEDMSQEAGQASSAERLDIAIGIFERVAREARELGLGLVEARAIHGLASAYVCSDDRRDAAPMMFEMASNMFWTAGEKSDAKTCILDASELFRSAQGYEDAIRCLVEYDTKSKSLVFSDRIQMLREELHQKNNPAPRSRLAHFFSSTM
ncbi:Diacylglycerol kinase eta [Hondaea fermentalgiana]|uniref:Diacylglycerol kinase eta n=1 Tax=Hondaea fermentalgiana TaxID=2315210 RepID=A0A2R5GJF5_9STRA|nr:Diacylglycerol kinase eta [Hondaea fermentalgiana]|eukprot:GBG27994.1 Diacylglycerol kinase eta [Hondaea fermentalgiana]